MVKEEKPGSTAIKSKPATASGGFDPNLLFFIASLCLAAMAYGFAAATYKLFPYQVYVNAKAAYGALKQIEPEDLPTNVIALDASAPARPTIATLSHDAGSENLLITGGPYEFMQRCPKFGCIAWVIDRKGNVLHSWETDIEKLYSDIPNLAGSPKPEDFHPSGLALTSDGGLIMAIQARNTYPVQIGLVRLDRAGNVVWKRWNNSHHWIKVAADGTIYAPYRSGINGMKYFADRAVSTECDANLEDEGVGVYTPDGKLLRRLPLIENIIKADYPGLLYGLRKGCDPLHLNSIDLVTPSIAKQIPGISAGDLLISLRESSVVAIIDGQDGHIKKLIAGRSAGQHSPKFLPDGTILVLDNLGGIKAQGGSRILRMNFNTGSSETVFPKAGETLELPFATSIAGHIDISADGRRAMITSWSPGRAFEIDVASGRPTWSYSNSLDLAPYFAAKSLHPKTTRARLKMWGVSYVSAAQLAATSFGVKPK